MHHFFQKKSNFGAFFGIGASIRMGREIQCLPYAGFFDLESDKLRFLAVPAQNAREGSLGTLFTSLIETQAGLGLSESEVSYLLCTVIRITE